jgi:sugar lactone lactonase YvrE
MRMLLLTGCFLFSAQVAMGGPTPLRPAERLSPNPASITLAVKEYRCIAQWGGNQTGVKFNHPLGIDCDTANNFYVADSFNKRIVKVNHINSTFTILGSGQKNLFNYPTDVKWGSIAFDAPDTLFAVDVVRNHIFRYDPYNYVWERFEPQQDKHGTIYSAAIIPGLNLLVSGHSIVRKYDIQRNYVQWDITTKISSPGPHLAVDKANNLYITDPNGITKYDINGTKSQIFHAEDAGRFDDYGPAGIAIDPEGNIFVADTIKDRVLKLSSTGKLITIITGSDTASPKNFNRPFGVAVNRDGLLFVSDTFNNRVMAFEKKMVAPVSTTTTTLRTP